MLLDIVSAIRTLFTYLITYLEAIFDALPGFTSFYLAGVCLFFAIRFIVMPLRSTGTREVFHFIKSRGD